jgi:hypothetical protein
MTLIIIYLYLPAYFGEMTNFLAQIFYGNKLLDIWFNKIAAPENKYFIEVNSDKSIIARFEMQEDHFNKWKIMMPAPEWVLNLELQLANVICRNDNSLIAKHQ